MYKSTAIPFPFQLKTLCVGVVMGAIALFAAAPAAHAQTYTQNFQTNNTSELIAYLRGVIAQLEAQLAAQRGQSAHTSASVSTYGISDSCYYCNYDGGQVRGASTQNYYDTSRNYRIRLSKVDTFNESDDEVTVETTITFGGAPYVDVWFQYGPNGYLEEDTRQERVYSNGRDTRDYRVRLTNLDGREYDFGFVRAIAEEPNGDRTYSPLSSFETDPAREYDRYRNDDHPDVRTERATNIEDDEATLEGDVDMNDFRNGLVFFAYGEDEDLVEEIEDEYDEYRDIDEEGDDLQVTRVDSDLDGDEDYRLRVTNLDNDTEYFFQICVEYEDEDDDETIECGGVENFETDD